MKFRFLLLTPVLLTFCSLPLDAWARIDASWQLNKDKGIIREAWAPETKGKFLALSYSCNNDGNRCGLFLSLPISCENAVGKVVAVPIKLGRKDDVAHLQCIGPGGWMEYSNRGLVGVHNMGKLSKDGDPVRVDLYSWSVELPKYNGQAVPDLDDHKTITFILGKDKYKFTLYGSHRAFQKVYEVATKNNTDSEDKE